MLLFQLADVSLELTTIIFLGDLRAFMKTLVRPWGGIDVWLLVGNNTLSRQPQLLRHLYSETEGLEKAYAGRRGQVVTPLTIV